MGKTRSQGLRRLLTPVAEHGWASLVLSCGDGSEIPLPGDQRRHQLRKMGHSVITWPCATLPGFCEHSVRNSWGLASYRSGAKPGYGVFGTITTRPGVNTVRFYITVGYPESLRSLSGSTVHPSTGTGMHIRIQTDACQCHRAVAPTALFTAIRRTN